MSMAPASTGKGGQDGGAGAAVPVLDSLARRLEDLVWHLERMHLAEYVALFQNPRRLLWLNFLSGVARGLGIAVGFAVLSAVLLIILQRLMMLNLPVIGDFIAQVVRVVQARMALYPP
ncbi:MAG TPA: DUF5665 domain-containing protein [Sphingobacteriaceae bacterium]|nr:DUF5665 domain-containing protein [Sphingobacteriaceae bacterium]